jgi:hypothetical protein
VILFQSRRRLNSSAAASAGDTLKLVIGNLRDPSQPHDTRVLEPSLSPGVREPGFEPPDQRSGAELFFVAYEYRLAFCNFVNRLDIACRRNAEGKIL